MSEMEDFVGQVRGLVISLRGFLTSEQSSQVEHLIDHGELGEGLRALAWILAAQNKKVPAEAVRTLRDLSAGLVAPEHMPDNFRS